MLTLFFTFLFVVALAGSYWLGYLPLFIPVLYMLLSFITFLLYAKDKTAAKNENRRTPENTLHLFALTGGWPGAKIAQQVFRHKTIKSSFQLTFWITVVLNMAALSWFHTRQGSVYLNAFTSELDAFIVNAMSGNNIKMILLYLIDFHS